MPRPHLTERDRQEVALVVRDPLRGGDITLMRKMPHHVAVDNREALLKACEIAGRRDNALNVSIYYSTMSGHLFRVERLEGHEWQYSILTNFEGLLEDVTHVGMTVDDCDTEEQAIIAVKLHLSLAEAGAAV